MSSSTPPPSQTEPISATPISSAPPPFSLVQLDPSKGSGKNIEGTSANPEDVASSKEMENKMEEVATKKSKARSREGEVKGKWWPCTTTEDELRSLEAEGFLQPKSWRAVPGAPTPAPEAGEWVLTKALVERGFSCPPSDFFTEILMDYNLQPHNISPNSILAIANHVTMCEGHLQVTPDLPLFQYFFSVKKETVLQTSSLATCGSITFKLRPDRVYPHTDRHESVRSIGFFYVKDVSDPASSKTLPEFKDGPASETPAWTKCPHISETPQLTRAVGRICKLTKDVLSGKDLTMSWFTKRIQPLQHRDRLMYQYTGHNDTMRASKDNLSGDALDKRIRVMIKIPRDVRSRVCNFDIHTDGADTALEALEKKDLGNLTRVPHSGNTHPEAASDAEAPEAPAPAKRKRATGSGRRQSEHARLRAPWPPRMPRKKNSASSTLTPAKARKLTSSSSSLNPAQIPKDVINLDDILEDPTADSGKGASSSKPPPEEPENTSAEAMSNDVGKKLMLSGATVWGKPETEQQDLSTLGDKLRVFFAKHKAVRQNACQLHEDLRTLVLEQKAEIEQLTKKRAEDQQAIAQLEARLKNNEEELAKLPSVDSVSAELEVLKAELTSLQNFLKESAEKETKAK
ncbi:hypothetical protein QYE76_066996 [Lolium multiflorum]|uniref:Transposase (putative) gypsy type domain-containing protein n=1 Tax=Lolium multiflorum TaxID=4521 RepID=A0AAD8SBK2_LOLMU|nr:hypothetical protein QYE76_066996 [Lolium multiflorum]